MIELLSSFWPFVLGAAGIAFGLFQRNSAKVARKDAEQSELKAKAHSKKAVLAKAITDTVVTENRRTKKAIKNAIKKANSRRNHFS